MDDGSNTGEETMTPGPNQPYTWEKVQGTMLPPKVGDGVWWEAIPGIDHGTLVGIEHVGGVGIAAVMPINGRAAARVKLAEVRRYPVVPLGECLRLLQEATTWRQEIQTTAATLHTVGTLLQALDRLCEGRGETVSTAEVRQQCMVMLALAGRQLEHLRATGQTTI